MKNIKTREQQKPKIKQQTTKKDTEPGSNTEPGNNNGTGDNNRRSDRDEMKTPREYTPGLMTQVRQSTQVKDIKGR